MKLKLSNRAILFSTVVCFPFTQFCIDKNSIAGDLSDAITHGVPNVDVRLRSETVSQQGVDKNANAITARTRIAYKSGSYMGFGGFFEFENTTALADKYAFPGSPNAGKYPVVADPKITRVNQAYLRYKYKDNLTLTGGRQRIILDGARFVGNVGWRQNEQTFDGALLKFKPLSMLTTTYAYLDQVNDIFGNQVKMKSHLLNLNFKPVKNIKLAAYGYFLDYDTGADSKTLGLSIDGSWPAPGMWKLLYRAEYAQMGDYADNKSGKTPNYANLELGGKINKTIAKIGYERLSGDGTASFQTPLATKHKFNGWADKFLATPANGLVDTYLTLGSVVKKIKLLGTFHLFNADHTSTKYGKELDLLAARKIAKNYIVGLKYANYMADKFATNTAKYWVWGEMKF